MVRAQCCTALGSRCLCGACMQVLAALGQQVPVRCMHASACCTAPGSGQQLEQPDELGRLFRRRALLLLSALNRQLLQVVREHLLQGRGGEGWEGMGSGWGVHTTGGRPPCQAASVAHRTNLDTSVSMTLVRDSVPGTTRPHLQRHVVRHDDFAADCAAGVIGGRRVELGQQEAGLQGGWSTDRWMVFPNSEQPSLGLLAP